MKRNSVQALMFAGFAGAVAPGALILLRGAMTTLVWGPSVRMAAFLGPQAQPPGIRITSLLLDALIGVAVGAALGWAVTRFARASHWRLALVFFGGFLAAGLALTVANGDFGFAAAALRRPVTLFFIVAAAGAFWLAPKSLRTAPPAA
jgi:hypothetical protein